MTRAPTSQERDERIRREEADKLAKAQTEADRQAAAEHAARELAKARAIEAQALLADLAPRLAGVIEILAHLENLRGPGILVDDIRDALRAAGVDVYTWRALSPLGEIGSPRPLQPWPRYQLG